MPNRSAAAQSDEITLLYLFKLMDLAIRSRMDELFRPVGLTALQYFALTVLERQPNLTSSQLARNSFVTAQTMADMVSALHSRGLLERHRDPDDRRRLVLTLTSEGRRILTRYRGRVGAIEDEMLGVLSRSQTAQLRSSLLACRGALTRGRTK